MGAERITSKNYEGDRVTLVDEDTHLPIMVGEFRDGRGDQKFAVVGGRGPHKISSSGKVWCHEPGGDPHDTFEFYPAVIKAKWVVDFVVADALLRVKLAKARAK